MGKYCVEGLRTVPLRYGYCASAVSVSVRNDSGRTVLTRSRDKREVCTQHKADLYVALR